MKRLFVVLAVMVGGILISSTSRSEEPNFSGDSCAAGNPKKCLEEADAAFNMGGRGSAGLVVQLLTRACDLDEPDGCFVLANTYRGGALGSPNMDASRRVF